MNESATLTLLGSTGSIGTQALSVAAFHHIPVKALCFGTNVKQGEEQIRRFSPEYCAVSSEKAAEELKIRIADTNTKILTGEEGICEMIEAAGSEICLNAISGFAGLRPTLTALSVSRRLAIANKETLVAAGDIVMKKVRETGCEIIPVDSEHSAIFQCLQGNRKREVKKILLTCSGGAFYGYSKEQLEKVTVLDALAHPTWRMGAKITVDCASLMNKGLEIIEAMHLFDISSDKIEVMIHRESIIHSMVEYIDHAVIAQLGSSDMRIPIQYALTYPERSDSPADVLDLFTKRTLTFARPDREAFPLLALAERAAKKRGTMPCAMNAANEEAVSLFLAGKITFTDIFSLVTEVAEGYPFLSDPTEEDIFSVNRGAREKVKSLVK